MNTTTPQSPKSGPFEFQNWPVYQRAVLVAKEAQKFCLSVPKTGNLSLCDQFRRASQSVVLNIAEGSSRTSTKDKVNFVRVAKGSVFECAAIVNLAYEFELMDLERHDAFQDSLANIGRMLSGIIRHFEKGNSGNTRAATSL
jgi:four helix bundle protein